MKKFTNVKPFSSLGGNDLFRFTGSRLKIIILVALLCTGLRLDLYSNCVGCGGQQGGPMPCFQPGDLIGEGPCWIIIDYPNGEWGTQETYYEGNCMLWQVFYLNGNWWSEASYPGGCGCDVPILPYDIVAFPLTEFDFHTDGTTFVEVSDEIPMLRLEVRELDENGKVVFVKNDSTPANEVVSIPISTFQFGVFYILLAYDLDNNTTTYLPLRRKAASFEELKYFCTWGTPDSVDVQRQCVVYTGPNDTTMMVVQHFDKSVEIFKGTTSVNVGIDPNEIINANATELSQNYPNPFYTSTAIDLNIHTSSNVSLAIYDIQGKEIERLVDCYLVPGKYQFIWKPTRHENGTFYYRLVSDYAIETKKMILLK